MWETNGRCTARLRVPCLHHHQKKRETVCHGPLDPTWYPPQDRVLLFDRICDVGESGAKNSGRTLWQMAVNMNQISQVFHNGPETNQANLQRRVYLQLQRRCLLLVLSCRFTFFLGKHIDVMIIKNGGNELTHQ